MAPVAVAPLFHPQPSRVRRGGGRMAGGLGMAAPGGGTFGECSPQGFLRRVWGGRAGGNHHHQHRKSGGLLGPAMAHGPWPAAGLFPGGFQLLSGLFPGWFRVVIIGRRALADKCFEFTGPTGPTTLHCLIRVLHWSRVTPRLSGADTAYEGYVGRRSITNIQSPKDFIPKPSNPPIPLLTDTHEASGPCLIRGRQTMVGGRAIRQM